MSLDKVNIDFSIGELLRKEKIFVNFYVQMICDMLVVGVLYFSYLFFKVQIGKRKKGLKTVNLSVRNYSLWVQGLPKDGVSEKELTGFFDKFFKVKKCAFAYKFKNCLGNMLNIGKIKNLIQTEKSSFIKNKSLLEKKVKNQKLKIKSYNKKLKSLNKKTNKKKFKLKKKLKSEILTIEKKLQKTSINIDNLNSFNIHSAFITFNDPKASKKLKTLFKKEYSKKNWKTILLCKKIKYNKDYIFKSKKLKLKTPDHPTNIYWENIEYSKTSRFIKFCLIIFASIIVILLSIIFNILFTSIIQNKECIDQDLVLDDILNSDDLNVRDLLYCFCSEQNFSDVFFSDGIFKENCNDFIRDKIVEVFVGLGVGVFLAVINFCIKLVVFFLVKFVRYSSKVKVAVRKTFLIFIVSYINTAFILCLIYQKFFGISFLEEMNKISSGFFGSRFYVQGLNRSWYSKVGSKLLLAIFISIFVPQITELFSQIFFNYLKKRKSKKAKTQREFIKILSPNSFHLENKFADVLRVIFVGVTFSTGIPLGIIAIFLSLLITFWTHKYICIKYSRKPALYSIKLIQSVVNIIPFSIFIHCFLAIYTLTNENIYPFTLKDSDFNFYIDNINQKSFINDFIIRCYKVLPYTILFSFFVILYFFEKFFMILFFIILKKKKDDSENLKTYDKCYKEIAYYSLPNYNMALNPKYKNILKLSFPLFYKIKSFIIAGNSIKNIISTNNLNKINRSLFPDSKYNSKIYKQNEKSVKSKFEIIIDKNIKGNNIKNNSIHQSIFKNKLIIDNEDKGILKVEEGFLNINKKDLSENIFNSNLKSIEEEIVINNFKNEKGEFVDNINNSKNQKFEKNLNNQNKINNLEDDKNKKKLIKKLDKNKLLSSQKKQEIKKDIQKIKTMIFKKKDRLKNKIKTYDNIAKEIKIENLKNIKITSRVNIIKQKEIYNTLKNNKSLKSIHNLKREILKQIELNEDQEIEIDDELDYDYCDESISEIFSENEDLSENDNNISELVSQNSENEIRKIFSDVKKIESFEKDFNKNLKENLEKENFLENDDKVLMMDSFLSDSVLNKTEKSVINKTLKDLKIK